MDTIHIGADAAQVLGKLAALSGEAVQDLDQRLRKVKLQVFPANEAARLAETVSKLDVETAVGITEFLLSVWYSESASKRSTREIVDDIVAQFERTEAAKVPDHGTPDALRRHLTTLLQNRELSNSQNASSLLLEGERVFYSARLLSDVRPIFDSVNQDELCGALVLHTLKISYYKADGDMEEFLIGLDGEDIDELVHILERAKKKAEVLRTMLQAAEVPYVSSIPTPRNE